MSLNARDIAQRSIGCIGFSALAHTTLIAALLLAPKSASDLGISAAGKQNLSEGEGSVEVVASGNQNAPAAAAAPVKSEPEEAVSAPAPQPPPPKVSQELPPPPAKKAVETALPKHVKTKVVVKASAAPKIKTTSESDVVTETKDKNVELENLSPVIAEEPLDPSSDGTAPEAPVPAPAAAAEAAAPAPAQEAAPAVTEKAAEPKAAIEDKAAPPSPATEEEAPKKGASTTPEESSGTGSGSGRADAASGSGNGEGAGNGSGSSSGPGSGKVIEASLRRPLPGNALPQYPRPDRLARREGTSIVIGDVRHDGTVENVRLERSSGSKDMDSAAIATFKKWKFAPGAEATVRKSFQYALQGPEQVSYTTLKR